jgi:hypothetical protein
MFTTSGNLNSFVRIQISIWYNFSSAGRTSINLCQTSKDELSLLLF